MATRGTALSRALTYFENEPDLNVVRIAFARAKEIVEQRLNAVAQPKLPFKRRTRKAKAASMQAQGGIGTETLASA
jgi:hypothetical protein